MDVAIGQGRQPSKEEVKSLIGYVHTPDEARIASDRGYNVYNFAHSSSRPSLLAFRTPLAIKS